MLLTTACALALTGALHTAPAPVAEPPAPVSYAAALQDSETPAPQLPETDTPPEAETPAAEDAPASPAKPGLPAVEGLPSRVADAAAALQGEIVTVMTPPEPEPEPEPAPPAEPTNQQLYGTVLGSYTTSYSTRQTNRCTNIRLAATAISGTVLQPGETFSFNTVVGRRTAARGYQVAHVYSGGKVEEGIGGGICQVSSTLFNAALLSNMTITARTSHGLPVSYLPAGRDATVSWGGPEFKFKNPYDFPVKITAGYDSGKGTITCSVLGPETASAPNVKISVSKSGEKYITKRSVNGKVNYTTTSVYKQPKTD